jgi:DNA-directed RNA polymerase subunit RPC12/RpoP
MSDGTNGLWAPDEDKTMEETRASLQITLTVNCPYCEEYFDLVADTNLNEEGWLLDEALPCEGHWADSHEKFETEVVCPKCSSDFIVKGIDW